MTIDRSSPLPLYFQLKEIMLKKIHTGEWKPGGKIPTEENIQNVYGLSRTTVRQAMQELEQSGQVTRQAGRGTFVRVAKVQEGTEPYMQTISEINVPGVDLTFKIISTGWLPAPKEAASLLHIAPAESVFCMRRLRLANQNPIGHTLSYFVKEFYDNLDLSRAEIRRQYELYQKRQPGSLHCRKDRGGYLAFSGRYATAGHGKICTSSDDYQGLT